MTTFSGHLTDAQAQRLVDGLLDPARDEGAEAHAHACADCAAVVEAFRLLGDALDDLPAPELPAGFTEAVMARVDEVEAARSRERRVAVGVFASVATALVGVLLAAGLGGLGATVSELGAAVTRAAEVLRLGSGVLPGVLSALRPHLVVLAVAVTVPAFLMLARLMPAHAAQPARTT